MTAPRRCDYCSTELAPAARACPRCRYPVGGDFGGAKERRRPRRPQPAEETCPQCGETFPSGRAACPHCGSDAQTGWKSAEEVDYQAVDVPDAFDDEDHAAAVADLPGGRAAFWRSRKGRLAVVGIVLVAAMTVPALVALWRLLR